MSLGFMDLWTGLLIRASVYCVTGVCDPSPGLLWVTLPNGALASSQEISYRYLEAAI